MVNLANCANLTSG